MNHSSSPCPTSPRLTHALQPKAASTTKTAGKPAHRFVVDYSVPAGDNVFDAAGFEKFLHDRIKVDGKPGQLGDAITLKREGELRSGVCAQMWCWWREVGGGRCDGKRSEPSSVDVSDVRRHASRDVSLRCRLLRPATAARPVATSFSSPKVGSVSEVAYSSLERWHTLSSRLPYAHPPALHPILDTPETRQLTPSRLEHPLFPSQIPAHKLVITTTIPFSKRYAKYLSKKFLKASFLVVGEVWEVE
jgi:large subunit ribosomal protein L22e